MNNEKYPYSGLTVLETTILEQAGWHETGFESLPPPWAHRATGRMMSPREALVIAMDELKATMLERP